VSIVQEWKEKWIATDKLRADALFDLEECRAELDDALTLVQERESELFAARNERDTARAAHLESQENGARVKLDRDKLFSECGAWEARYVRRGHELRALQAKVARAVELLTDAQADGPTTLRRALWAALEALR